jgi:hypothetical protein
MAGSPDAPHADSTPGTKPRSHYGPTYCSGMADVKSQRSALPARTVEVARAQFRTRFQDLRAGRWPLKQEIAAVRRVVRQWIHRQIRPDRHDTPVMG